ncbi:hypothetical protein [Methylocystis sp. SC2]|uniref:hypothetical protein n=1 Tax=Methylocystis sp. (strain SC2) TaxID=187303 RepID=UPI00027AF53F|nr:hypothetical protein [Methylocystis sp. SC2]CCJ09075.1 Hypothetical protein BN69_3624 [Methylocystis sp. SC2]
MFDSIPEPAKRHCKIYFRRDFRNPAVPDSLEQIKPFVAQIKESFPDILDGVFIEEASTQESFSEYLKIGSHGVILFDHSQRKFLEHLLFYKLGFFKPIFPFAFFCRHLSHSLLASGFPYAALGLADCCYAIIKKFSDYKQTFPYINAEIRTQPKILDELTDVFIPIASSLFILGHEIGHHAFANNRVHEAITTVVDEEIQNILSRYASEADAIANEIESPLVAVKLNPLTGIIEQRVDYAEDAIFSKLELLREEIVSDIVACIFLTSYLSMSSRAHRLAITTVATLLEGFEKCYFINSIFNRVPVEDKEFELHFEASRSKFRGRIIFRLLYRLSNILPMQSFASYWKTAHEEFYFLAEDSGQLDYESHLMGRSSEFARGALCVGFTKELPKDIPENSVELEKKFGDKAGLYGLMYRPFKSANLTAYNIVEHFDWQPNEDSPDSGLVGFASAIRFASMSRFRSKDIKLEFGDDILKWANAMGEISYLIDYPWACVEKMEIIDIDQYLKDCRNPAIG